ncbi:MAG: hypothetical protein HZB29_06555 [Nitrospinae bacterium]|nr:hypothetical protein [Nitrospinota bacterium]
MSIFDGFARRRNRRFTENFLGVKLMETVMREEWVKTSSGVNVRVHVHAPATGAVKFPAVVFVPGGASRGTDYDYKGEISAWETAGLGHVVVTYDPSGRGGSGGVEDHWGPASQMELSEIIRWTAQLPQTDPDRIGVVSFSIGVAIATGALARFPTAPVRFLFDWEGPSSRKIITRNDTHKPLARFPSSNAAFWDEREASRFIGDMECGYFRYQAQVDHVQGTFKGHAMELLNAATQGRARWTRLNGNPPNITLDPERADKYRWIPQTENHRGTMLKFLLSLWEER